MADDLTPEVLILAAGAASRFGSVKALAPWGNECLLAHVIRVTHEAVGHRPWVVLGSAAPDIESTLNAQGCEYRGLRNERWSVGLSSSLQCGIAAIVLERPQTRAVLVTLGDQPCLSIDELQGLIALWRIDPERIVAADYAGQAGAPCILPRSLFAQVADLRGDQGARTLLRDNATVRTLPIASAAWDVDTPEDLQRAWSRFGNPDA